MEVKYISLEQEFKIEDEICLCLGYFDGIHLGHQKLIQKAKESIYKSGLLTFEFLDNFSFKKDRYITSLDDKIEILESCGVDYLIILRFDDKVKNLSCDEFIHKIIVKLNAKEVVVGQDYTFAKMAEGNVETLKTYHDLFKVDVVDELLDDGKKIGTRNIISLIEEGKIEKANLLLGHNYQITGEVLKGYGFGNKHHFPTANVALNKYVKPQNGVYACLIIIDKIKYRGMCNIGVHPTVNQLDKAVIEVNIFDFNEDIYHHKIKIQLIKYMREEMKFNNIDELYAQLLIDKENAIDYFKNK